MDKLSNAISPEVAQLLSQIAALQQKLGECHNAFARAHDAEQKYRVFSEGVRDYAFITFDPATHIQSWSLGAERIFKFSEQDVLGKPGCIIFTPEDRAAGVADAEMLNARQFGHADDERWHVRKDGSRFWASGVMTAHVGQDGAVEGYSKVLRDLTARKVAEDQLRVSGEQLRLLVENARDYALIPVDTHGLVTGWNSGAERTFGYSREEILGQSARLFFTPEDAEKGESEKDLNKALMDGRAEDERWMVRKGGARFWSRWVTTPVRNGAGEIQGFAKVLRDETEKKRVEDRLTQSLEEKELLLRDIHHRVKNNLSVITSLISIHSNEIADQQMRERFQKLEDRVRAIAVLHETLYESPRLGDVLFGPYLEHLLRELVDFHQIDSRRIAFKVASDDVVLSIEQALPLGLIVNELTSNALKHAFPGRAGCIQVSLRYVENGSCELVVHDDGVGFVDAHKSWNSKSMGLQIFHLLTKQLQGTSQINCDTGTRIAVRFALKPASISDQR